MAAPRLAALHPASLPYGCDPRLVTSPVEARFRLDAAPDVDAVPDLVHDPAPPHPLSPVLSVPPSYATFPRRSAARPSLRLDFIASHSLSPPATPEPYGGVSMVRSVSQPVLTGAEHAQYTASRAASLSRIASRSGSGASSARSRPSLFGALTRLEDDGESPDVEEIDREGNVEMVVSEERQYTPPAIHRGDHSSCPEPRVPYPRLETGSAPPFPFCQREMPRPSTADEQQLTRSFPPRALSPSRPSTADGPLPRTRSFAPRTLSTSSSRNASSYDPRTPRTPSPRSASHTSRLTPTSRARVRPVHPAGRASPTPSTNSRAAAWRARAGGVRCVARVKVEEAV